MQARFHTPFREKLIRLADGTRTDKELARLTGSTPGSVRVALTSLRQQGIPVRATRFGGRQGGMPRAEYDLMTALREDGFAWSHIAKLRQHDEVSVRNRYARASKKFGLPMPNVPRKKKEIQPATTSVCAN